MMRTYVGSLRRGLGGGLFGLMLLGAAHAETDPAGLWLTDSGATVRIARCGRGYCGTLAAVPGPGIDANNPDPALRTRKLAGLKIVDATTPNSDGYRGTLYNPLDGKTYAGTMTLKGADRLEVEGCVLRIFCQRQTWQRTR